MAARTLVTGASRGLGRAFAQALAAKGRGLVLSARSQPQLASLAAELRRQHHVEVDTVAQDLSVAGGAQALAEACRDHAIEGLVNNAGTGLVGPFAEHDPAALEALVCLDVTAPTMLLHRLLPSLKSHRGFVINVASTAGFQPIPNFAAYAASKAYLLSLSEALHEELAPAGVRALALCPGPTATEFFITAGADVNKNIGHTDDPQAVVQAALQALEARQPRVVTGWRNRVLVASGKLLPRTLQTRAAGQVVARWRSPRG